MTEAHDAFGLIGPGEFSTSGPMPFLPAGSLGASMLHALLFGLCLPVVVRMNEALSQRIGYLPGSWVVHLAGAVFGAVALLPFAGKNWVSAVPSVPWWAWLGGVLGSGMVVLATQAVGALGIAGFTAVTVAVQLVVSAVIDHFGLIGTPIHLLTATRAAGIALLGVGAVLVVRG